MTPIEAIENFKQSNVGGWRYQVTHICKGDTIPHEGHILNRYQTEEAIMDFWLLTFYMNDDRHDGRQGDGSLISHWKIFNEYGNEINTWDCY